MKKTTLFWLMGVMGAEALSAAAIFFPTLNAVFTVLLGLGLFILTIKRPVWAMSVLSVEYLIGSKGALFKFGGGGNNNGGVPIRMVFFAAFLLGWLVLVIKYKTWHGWFEFLRSRLEYLLFALVLVYAFVLGWMRGNPFLLADANAWGALLLLLPFLDVISQDKEEAKRVLIPAMLAALFWLPVKTLVLFYLFTHAFPAGWLASVYVWVRRTGVGEITPNPGMGARIFFQSHLYAAFVILAAFVWAAFRGANKRWMFWILSLSIAQILISLSRSLWMGAAAGFLFCTFYLLRRKNAKIVVGWKRVLGAGLVAFGMIVLIFYFPFPTPNGSLLKLFKARVNTMEAGAISRWQLLPILWEKIKERPVSGSGFGATVTYQTQDPRIVEATGGTYTTYAFEWGWLDFWIKFGIVGIPFFLFFFWRLGQRVLKAELPEWIKVSLLGSMVTLAVTHFFTPYVNHPLGLFALMAMESILLYKGTIAYDPAQTVTVP